MWEECRMVRRTQFVGHFVGCTARSQRYTWKYSSFSNGIIGGRTECFAFMLNMILCIISITERLVFMAVISLHSFVFWNSVSRRTVTHFVYRYLEMCIKTFFAIGGARPLWIPCELKGPTQDSEENPKQRKMCRLRNKQQQIHKEIIQI